jgi:hypothetical protein
LGSGVGGTAVGSRSARAEAGVTGGVGGWGSDSSLKGTAVGISVGKTTDPPSTVWQATPQARMTNKSKIRYNRSDIHFYTIYYEQTQDESKIT